MGIEVKDDQANRIDCDPRGVGNKLHEYLDKQLFVSKFVADCAEGENFNKIADIKVANADVKAAKMTSQDRQVHTLAMINFVRTCLQNSRLPEEKVADLQKVVADVDAAQDDQAQSFVVSWNAFTEENATSTRRLAWLALTLACIVDGLILLAGLFGATTMLGPLAKAGLREVSARVRRLPAKDVRFALAGLRDNAFDGSLLEDERISRIVRLGLERQIPGEAAGVSLVVREADQRGSRYRLHKMYLDELEELVQRAEKRGEFAPVSAAEPETAARPAPAAGTRDASDEEDLNEAFRTFAPRRAA
jgi:hypothetical protein